MPVWVRLPLPLTAAKASVRVSPWLKIRLPLFNTPLVLAIDAPLPPLPICNVPAAIVVRPV